MKFLGQAACDMGVRNKIQADGPKGGNNNGKLTKQAVNVIVPKAVDPDINTKNKVNILGSFTFL